MGVELELPSEEVVAITPVRFLRIGTDATTIDSSAGLKSRDVGLLVMTMVLNNSARMVLNSATVLG